MRRLQDFAAVAATRNMRRARAQPSQRSLSVYRASNSGHDTDCDVTKVASCDRYVEALVRMISAASI